MYQLLKTIKSYNKQTDWHSSKFDGYDLSKFLLKFIHLLKGKKVLDFGCGNGRDLESFYKKGLNVIGIDYSDELIKRARNRVKNVNILKMNFVTKLSFKDKEFDGIWASASLLHVPKKSLDKVLSELRRILNNRGVLFISVKEGKGERIIKDDYGYEERFFSFFKKRELVNILIKAGFKILQVSVVTDEKLRVAFQKKKIKQNWIFLYCTKDQQ
ncbi:class I SAM-dependent methyltransferase [Candidatus Woesearchaeota archaeon]|nr:class I SAM-dependent methyltransferase [Candidatus Woesearchaeota archaeon]